MAELALIFGVVAIVGAGLSVLYVAVPKSLRDHIDGITRTPKD